LRYLFDHWRNISSRVKRSKVTCILSDYDGTLTPIAPRPELAFLSEEMRETLRKLSVDPRYILAIVSGRPVKEVESRVGIEGIFYAGNHGLEIKGPSRDYRHPKAAEFTPQIERICSELRSMLEDVEGVIVEDKGLTASIHYRLTPPHKVSRLRSILERTVERFNGIKIFKGKKVFEVRPDLNWNKGMAAEWIVKSLTKDALPIYLGDDKTDEDAFVALERGITVCITPKPRRSHAKYYLESVRQVQEFFEKLLSIK